jgi:hypothetical protein
MSRRPKTALVVPDDSAAIAAVKAWICEGRPAPEVLAKIGEEYPGRTAADLMGAAVDDIRADATELDQTAATGFLLNAYRETYRAAFAAADFGAAVSALRGFERRAGL